MNYLGYSYNLKRKAIYLEASKIKGTLEPCKQALKDAGLKAGDISEIILVGGSTRIPLVQKVVTYFFVFRMNSRFHFTCLQIYCLTF